MSVVKLKTIKNIYYLPINNSNDMYNPKNDPEY